MRAIAKMLAPILLLGMLNSVPALAQDNSVDPIRHDGQASTRSYLRTAQVQQQYDQQGQQQAMGPSFDCGNAGNAARRTICATPELSALDLQLMRAFRRQVRAAPRRYRRLMRAQQRAWRWNRNRCRTDVACLLYSYHSRMAALRASAGTAPANNAAPQAPGPTASNFAMLYDFDLPSADYRSGMNDMRLRGIPLRACQAQCAADSGCRAFTYNSNARVCFLKNAVPPRVRFAGAVSGIKVNDVGAGQPAPGVQATLQPPAQPATPPQDQSAVEPPAQPAPTPQDQSAVEPQTQPANPAQDQSAVEPPAQPATPAQDQSAVEPQTQPATPPQDQSAVEPPAQPAPTPQDQSAVEPQTQPATPAQVQAAVEPPAQPRAQDNQPSPTAGVEPGAQAMVQPRTGPLHLPTFIDLRYRRAGGLSNQISQALVAASDKFIAAPPNDNPAKPAPDGSELWLLGNTLLEHAAVRKLEGKTAKFNRRDFVPIARLAARPFVLLVNSKLAYASLKDFIDDAKKRPGQIAFAASQFGADHVAMTLFMKAAGIELKFVQDDRPRGAWDDIYSNQAQIMVAVPEDARKGIQESKIQAGSANRLAVRALATFGAARSKALPDVPTMSEQGSPFEFYDWRGIFASKDTPAGLVALLDSTISQAARSRAFVDGLKKIAQGADVDEFSYLDRADFARFIDAQAKRVETAIAEIDRQTGYSHRFKAQ